MYSRFHKRNHTKLELIFIYIFKIIKNIFLNIFKFILK